MSNAELIERLVSPATPTIYGQDVMTMREAAHAIESADKRIADLTDEIERLRGEIAAMTERHEQVCIGAREELRKRWDAEAGYNVIAERLYFSPLALIDTRDVLSICALREEDFPALYALQGKRVRLVVEGDE